MELATEAGQLIERKEIDTALVALRDALALDPGCQEARRLHDATQRETRRRSVRPQIETLVRKSEDAIAARQFTDALQNLDLAQRLDPSDPDLQMRLERARSLHECSLAARASLTAAREELANQRLQEAHERVREALIADPGNPSAERLLEVVRDAIARAESESKYGEHLDIARHFFASNDFNRAIGVLSALCAARPDVDEARQLLAQAQQRQLASELETAAVARARKILSKGEFAEATELLEKLRADSPSNPEVLDLLEEATAGKLRSERIAQVVTRAALLREALDYPAALDALRGALTSYPESYELRAALRTAQDAQRRHESEQAARQAMFASMAEREPEETPTKILQPADLRPPPSIEPERTPAIVPRRRVLFAGIGAVSVLLFVIVFFRPNVRPNPVEQTHTAQPDIQAEPPRLAPVHSTREPAVTNPKVDHKVEVPIVSVGKENTALSAPSPTDLIVKSLNSANTVPPRAAPTEEKPPIKPPATAALPASTQTASLPTVQPAVTPPSSTPAPTPIVSAPRPVSTIPAAAEARDRGMHLVSLKSYDEAIGNFTEAIRLRPDYAAAYRDRGATYQNMYRFREAIEDYRKTLSIDPNYRDAGGLLKDAEYKLSIGLQQPDKYFRQPQTIDAPDARYTAEAIRAGATHGVVRLIFVVDAHGHADDFRVLESPGFHLDEEAIRAVGKCKFRPAEKNGSPVPYEVSLSVKFRRP